MRFLKKNEGITLVELMVSIAIGSMIMLAASTVLLLGLRVNHQTTEAVTQQYTARTVLTLMENLATEGKIERINHHKDGSWEIGNIPEGSSEINVILSYDVNQKAILRGGIGSSAKMLENIVASYVLMEVPIENEKKELEYKVLTVSIEDTKHTYTTSVYCRANQVEGNTSFNSSISKLPTIQREFFLRFLASQVGFRGGIIHHDKEPFASEFCQEYDFFSEWYIGGFDANAKAQGWNENTPWCACFISWGLYAVHENHGKINGILNDRENPSDAEGADQDENADVGGNTNIPLPKQLLLQGDEQKEGEGPKWFANVDEFKKYFTDIQNAYTEFVKDKQIKEEDILQIWTESSILPEFGDLIFFNTISDDINNPSHMGAVLRIEPIEGEEGKWYVYTIEGNSADMVAVRQYRCDDDDIIGYGDPWAAQAAAEVMPPQDIIITDPEHFQKGVLRLLFCPKTVRNDESNVGRGLVPRRRKWNISGFPAGK